MKVCITHKIEREDFQGASFPEINEGHFLHQTILTSNNDEPWRCKNAALLNNPLGSSEWLTLSFIFGSRLNDCSRSFASISVVAL